MSNRTILQRRLPLLVAASIAGLGLAASPALAGSDGDKPPAIEQPPAPPAPAPLPLPAPVPAPAPAPAPVPTSGTHGKQAQNTPEKQKTPAWKPTRHTVALVSQTTTKTTGTTVTTIPTGSVQAGAGGTALEPGTPVAAIGLGGAAFALLLASGGLAAVRRRGASS